MSSFNVPGMAASRARGAASPATDLLQQGAKRLRKRPAAGREPSSGGAATGDVDAAVQTGAADGSATTTPSHAGEKTVQVQLNGEASIGTNSGQLDLSEDALAGRLLLVLSGSSTFPAASGKPTAPTDFTLGMLQAVHLSVERVWQMPGLTLPSENGLKPKAHAWLAADLLGDPFLLSEAALKLGKVMHTRVVSFRGEERAEQNKGGAERRAAEKAAEESGLEGSLDAARVAAAARLQERLHALHSSVYPAYANAYRPPPDTSSRPPTPRPSPDADDEHDDDAAGTGAAAATEAVDSSTPWGSTPSVCGQMTQRGVQNTEAP